ISHYRLQSLLIYAFPPDPRRRESKPRRFLFFPLRPALIQRRRPVGLVTKAETTWLLLSLPFWATLAQICWRLLPRGHNQLAFSGRAWRSLVLFWFVGLMVVIIASLLSYLRQGRM